MTPILTRLARDIDLALGGSVCRDAIRDASNGGADLSLVHWRFLADMLCAMPPAADKLQAITDPVIAGMDRLGRGEEWTEAEAAAAWAAAAAVAVAASGRAEVAAWAAWAWAAAEAAWAAAEARALQAGWAAAAAARWATSAGVIRLHQRDILLRLIEEAGE
jgi:hypothetical protein